MRQNSQKIFSCIDLTVLWEKNKTKLNRKTRSLSGFKHDTLYDYNIYEGMKTVLQPVLPDKLSFL